ncbi:hypothetical protein Agub_g8662, partial [Astrephomene gubernaculifera]
MSTLGRDNNGILQEVLRQASRGSPDSAEPAWSQEQWCEAFSFLFLASPGSRHTLLEHQDDMLFFVTAASALGPDSPTVWLRRNTAAELPGELRPGGSGFSSVDWCRSVQLNLVLQAKYLLTVVQCRQEALAAVAQTHATSGQGIAPQHQQQQALVSQRRVYASPMAAAVNLDDVKKGKPPQPCYPEVCFAVDNFEDAFQDMILSRPGDCYCVMLHVHANSNNINTGNSTRDATKQPITDLPDALPSSGHAATSPSSTPAQSSSSNPTERRAVLFSAYVTREQVAAYLATRATQAPRPNVLRWLLSGLKQEDAAQARRERVVLSGPGGIGRAEAAAAAVKADSVAAAAPAGAAG